MTVTRRPDPGFLEIHQGEWQGLHRDEIGARYAAELAAWRRAPLEAWAPGGESLPEVAGTGPAGAGRRCSRGSPRAGRPARSTGRRSPATRDPVPDHPWSIVVGHDGVFKVALLTLFDLPLDRFWMWSMDLCGISVIEFRAGRPVLRAHNLTAHLAALDATRRPLAEPRGTKPERRPLAARRRCRRCAQRRRRRSLRRKASRSRPTRSRRCAACRLASRSSPRISRA